MKGLEIAARMPKINKEASITVNMPETLEEAAKWASSEAILSNAIANAKVTIQAGIRRELEAGTSPADIQKKFGSYVMGIAVIGAARDPIAASLAKFKTMNKQEQSAYLADLKAAAQG